MASQPTEQRLLQVSREEVLEHLEAVLGSRAFASSDRLRRFLRFIVERTIAGQKDDVKEYSIGIDVFDRAPGYDPRTDPIVRVHASKLRDRLREYYATEGAQSRAQIDVPKGSYVPAFHRCPGAETSALQPPATTHRPRFSARTLKWILAAILVVLAAGVFAVRFLRPVHHGVIRSVVVLPFVNRGAGSGDEYISDSLTDEVTNDLS